MAGRELNIPPIFRLEKKELLGREGEHGNGLTGTNRGDVRGRFFRDDARVGATTLLSTSGRGFDDDGNIPLSASSVLWDRRDSAAGTASLDALENAVVVSSVLVDVRKICEF